MMFSSADLKHIELEMLNAVSADSAPCQSPEPSKKVFIDAIETPTDLYIWARKNESQLLQILGQLERLWQNSSEDAPQKGYKKRE
ncbi:hypothetical protein [Leptolyngbya sp. Heron Island J]|uniref:hypothetical protein n=1 Tax=Leptolyngbya sp. Heron Island J TaxID=1385935 RepID=UPI001267941C|nr:hypothetical protein [Leptolyngbya sp. Heron Island J]